MKTIKRFVVYTLALAMLVGLSGCGTMTHREKSTAIGAEVRAHCGEH